MIKHKLRAALEWVKEVNEIAVDHLADWLSWAGANPWAVALIAVNALMGGFFVFTRRPPRHPEITVEGQMPGVAATPFTLPSQLNYNCNTTGCVSRKLSSRITDAVSVMDYGAHSNTESGYTTYDSSAALTACLLANHTCYIPPGRYHVDSAGIPADGLGGVVMCAGPNKTVLWNDQGSPILTSVGVLSAGQAVNTFGDIIHVQGCRFELSNNSKALALNRHAGEGVVAGLAQVNFLDNVVYSADGGEGLDLIGFISATISRNVFYGTTIGYTSTFTAMSFDTIGDSYALNANVSDNTFSSIKTGVSMTSLPAYWTHNAGHRIVNNLMIGLTGYAAYGTYLDHITIQENMFDYIGCGTSGETATAAIFMDSVAGLRITDNPWMASRYTCPVVDIRSSSASVGENPENVVSRNVIRNVSYGGAGSSGILLNTSNGNLNFFEVSNNHINIAQTCISINATGSTVLSQGKVTGNSMRGCPTGITFGTQTTANLVSENIFENTVTTPITGNGFGNQSIGVNIFSALPSDAPHTLTYSASMTPNGLTSKTEVITATNNTAFTINAPTNVPNGSTLTFYIKNTSGGALGAATWAAQYKLAGAWVQPATGNGRTITFVASGGLWQELSRAAADLPN